MIALLQRVAEARVELRAPEERRVAGAIDGGIVLFVCAEPDDDARIAEALVDKVLRMRIFADAAGKMNLDLAAIGGGLLVVSQFTLAADTAGGNRPSFTNAAPPDEGRRLYDYFVAQARLAHPVVQTGEFAADMKVRLVNDGPVTIPLAVK